MKNKQNFLLKEIERLERENLHIYTDLLKLQKRIQVHTQRINDIIYQFGIYCLNKLHTKECDINMLLRWHYDFIDNLRVEKELKEKYSKLEHTYRNNQLIIKDLKIDAHIFPNDIKWASRSKL